MGLKNTYAVSPKRIVTWLENSKSNKNFLTYSSAGKLPQWGAETSI